MNILKEIVAARKKEYLLERKKHSYVLPEKRSVPLIPFFTNKHFFICEFKKASPAKGNFKLSKTYREILAAYQKNGIKNFSVLTEKNYFNGSLLDLIYLKKLAPRQAFLRKDFLYCREDIITSYLAGADAILLIAEILSAAKLEELISLTKKLKLQVLCEVHSKQSLTKVLGLKNKPEAIGINARDLKTLEINPAVPLQLKPFIPKSIKTVFESGVNDSYLAELIGNSRFNCILIGEAAVKNPEIIQQLQKAFKKGLAQKPNFFTKLYARKKAIFIKICGITNKKDALLAKKCGADILGLILAESPRKINQKFIKSLKKIKILKVAVVKDQNTSGLQQLIKNNYIDAVQFHGQENKELVYSFAGNAYKVNAPLLPVSLCDQLNPTGSWIAGKLNPKNIKKIIRKVKPQLVDVCSGIESKPGQKDPRKIKKFINEVNHV